MRVLVVGGISIFLVSACITNETGKGGPGLVTQDVTPEVTNRLALCGAGISSSLSTSLVARVGENLSQGATISASVKDDLQAAFLSNNLGREAYLRYVECVEKPL